LKEWVRRWFVKQYVETKCDVAKLSVSNEGKKEGGGLNELQLPHLAPQSRPTDSQCFRGFVTAPFMGIQNSPEFHAFR
jgi:hypothetical protein